MSKEKSVSELCELSRRSGLRKAAQMQNALSGISDWWQTLSPQARTAILGGGGALAGGLLGGAVGRSTGADKRVISPAMLGALLGGTAGAGIPAGLRMLGNTGGPKKTMWGRTSDVVAAPLTQAPGAAIGAGVGAYGGLASKLLGGPGNRQAVQEAWQASNMLSPATGSTAQRIGQGAQRAGRAFGKMKPRGKAGLAAIPISALLGMLAQRHITGEA